MNEKYQDVCASKKPCSSEERNATLYFYISFLSTSDIYYWDLYKMIVLELYLSTHSVKGNPKNMFLFTKIITKYDSTKIVIEKIHAESNSFAIQSDPKHIIDEIRSHSCSFWSLYITCSPSCNFQSFQRKGLASKFNYTNEPFVKAQNSIIKLKSHITLITRVNLRSDFFFFFAQRTGNIILLFYHLLISTQHFHLPKKTFKNLLGAKFFFLVLAQYFWYKFKRKYTDINSLNY